MDVKLKYIKDAPYDVDEYFVEQLQELDIRTGIKIAKYIDKNINKVSTNKLISTVIGGLVIDDDDEPITFALEIIKGKSKSIILSDIQLISMDEYLDLLNELKLNIKSNDTRESKSNKKNSIEYM
tara:strand:- start:4503 stop:4877 length:375 start_codon:yes stop_codon:yes gene_type:complete